MIKISLFYFLMLFSRHSFKENHLWYQPPCGCCNTSSGLLKIPGVAGTNFILQNLSSTFTNAKSFIKLSIDKVEGSLKQTAKQINKLIYTNLALRGPLYTYLVHKVFTKYLNNRCSFHKRKFFVFRIDLANFHFHLQ